MTHIQVEAIVMKIELLESEILFTSDMDVKVRNAAIVQGLYWVLQLLNINIEDIRAKIVSIKNRSWQKAVESVRAANELKATQIQPKSVESVITDEELVASSESIRSRYNRLYYGTDTTLPVKSTSDGSQGPV
jgi:hypothetical protein